MSDIYIAPNKPNLVTKINNIMLTKHKFNPNYYLSVARVDSSSIESTCIFPKTL